MKSLKDYIDDQPSYKISDLQKIKDSLRGEVRDGSVDSDSDDAVELVNSHFKQMKMKIPVPSDKIMWRQYSNVIKYIVKYIENHAMR